MYAASMDIERLDKEALRNILKIYYVRGQSLGEIKAFYGEASACVRVDGELSESFPIGVGVRQEYVMLPWLFNIFMKSE